MGHLLDLRRRLVIEEHPGPFVSVVTERRQGQTSGDLFRLAPHVQTAERFDQYARTRVRPDDVEGEKGGGVYHYFELRDGWYEAHSTSPRPLVGQRTYFEVRGPIVAATIGMGEYNRDRILAGVLGHDVDEFLERRDADDLERRAADLAAGWVPLVAAESPAPTPLRVSERRRRKTMAAVAQWLEINWADPYPRKIVLDELARVREADWWDAVRKSSASAVVDDVVAWCAARRGARA